MLKLRRTSRRFALPFSTAELLRRMNRFNPVIAPPSPLAMEDKQDL
ncbi:MAG: hypothetical protein WAV28_14565 [Sedimentisphaerales bacterium]